MDRHIQELVTDGTLTKLSQGIYHYPKQTAFGMAAPAEDLLVKKFLRDDNFLITSPNLYNGLGVGTTQLYNKRVVYNKKRHGEFDFGNRKFVFELKSSFPKTLTTEFLVVDMVNNLEKLAEDRSEVVKNLSQKINKMDRNKLSNSLDKYGTPQAKRLLKPLLYPV